MPLGLSCCDDWAVRWVEGLTEDQLKARFDYLRTSGEVTPYCSLQRLLTVG